MQKLVSIFGVILAIIGIIGVIAFLLGFPLMVMWNDLMPSIFGLRELSFWEAVELNVMCGILFGSWSGVKSSK